MIEIITHFFFEKCIFFKVGVGVPTVQLVNCMAKGSLKVL